MRGTVQPHAGFLINVPMNSGKHGITPVKVALHLNRASAHYGIGMRTYYFSVPLVLSLFGPAWMLIATISLLLILRHLDHLPQQEG